MKYLIFIGYTLFIILVSVLAYLNIIPTQQIKIPYYDYIGHFVLYSIWAYLFALVLPQRLFSILKLPVPTGILVVTGITIIEECFQSLSAVRSFSLIDLGCSLTGIAVSNLYYQYKVYASM